MDFIVVKEYAVLELERPPQASNTYPQDINRQFLRVRSLSESLCQPLLVDDYNLQAIAETSPAKWHIAHTSWFFETFILKTYQANFKPFDPQFEYLFNSYYNGIGAQFPRTKRSLLSRPSVVQVYRYRHHVNEAMQTLMNDPRFQQQAEAWALIELGCHHEQQHQELFLTDLKYCWYQNPLYPRYSETDLSTEAPLTPINWQQHEAGLYRIGHEKEDFCFDNEQPAHSAYLPAFSLADRLVSNVEYLAFMDDDGYCRPELWLADGWAELQQKQAPIARKPLYWLKQGQNWFEYSLHGLIPLDPHRPVSHLSAYEADAYARWADCRLPTEQEWEVSSQQHKQTTIAEKGGFLLKERYHPSSVIDTSATAITGQLWQWTCSAYSPYPGFSPVEGAVGEYNGKFMANQLVLRGGSCLTNRSHYRNSYRNFFYAKDQWQFTGLRLAKNG